jgi:hypothetical protein
MLTETLRLIAHQLFFMTAEEAQVFLDKHYPDYTIEVHDDSSATVSGPDGEFNIGAATPSDGEA